MDRICSGIAVVVLFVSCNSAFSQEVDDWVVVLRSTPLKIGEKALETLSAGQCAQVQAVEGEWFWVAPGSAGWIARRDVVMPGRAIDLFSEQIGRHPRDVAAYVARAN